MDLLDDDPELDLYDKEWLIHTRSEERAPAKVGPTAQVHRSLISHGCEIAGHGRQLRPVAGRPGRRRAPSCATRSSCSTRSSGPARWSTGRSSTRRSSIGPGAIVGDGPIDDRPNRQEPGRLNTGITVVGKRAIVPRGVADRAQRQGSRPTSGRPTSPAGSCAAASPSTSAVPARRRARAAAKPTRPAERAVGRRRPEGRPARRHGLADAAGAGRRRPPISARLPGPCHPPSRARAPCGRADVEGWFTELGLAPSERAEREGIASWDLVLDGRRRFDLRDHGHPRSGARDHLLGALRAADQRHVPQVVPQAAALERRVPVRQVLGRRGRAAAAGRRAADRAGRRRRARAWRSRGSSAIADQLLEESKDWLWIGGRIPDQA